MPIHTRQIATVDAARIREALRTAGVRHAIQIDGDCATLAFLSDDARAAADAIAAELSR